jgi:phospholipid/cholesterol/gamma-HCH transport system substrate-binding protein
METRASYILVGTFVLGLIGAIIGIAIWLAGIEFDKTPTPYLSYFEGDVTGLGVGSPVRYRGVPVGSVRDIRIDPKDIERVRVLMEVSADTPIKADTVAQLNLQGITGVAFVQLTGGTQAVGLLTPQKNKSLPVITSRPSVFQRVITRLPEIIEKIDLAATGLAALFNDKNIAALTSTLENIERTSRSVGKETDQIAGLLREGRAAADALRNAGDNITALVAVLDRETKPIAKEAITSMAEFRKTMAAVREGIGTLNRVAADAQSVMDDSKAPLRDFTNSGLYEFSTFFAEARVLVDSLTRLTDKIERDPANFFFGDSQRGVKAQ